jgi:hypothetical protein
MVAAADPVDMNPAPTCPPPSVPSAGSPTSMPSSSSFSGTSATSFDEDAEKSRGVPALAPMVGRGALRPRFVEVFQPVCGCKFPAQPDTLRNTSDIVL